MKNFNFFKILSPLFIAVSALVLALASALFIIPQRLVVGGLSGLSIILNFIFPLGESIWIVVLSLVCFLLGSLLFGRAFLLKTALFSVLFPLFSYLFLKIPPPASEPLIASVIGGILSALALSIAFSLGASTGGVDVISLSLSSLVGMRLEIAVLFVDVSVILLGILFINDIKSILLGIVCALFTSVFLRLFMQIFEKTVKFYVKYAKGERLKQDYITNF